jgi:hypothetical protein
VRPGNVESFRHFPNSGAVGHLKAAGSSLDTPVPLYDCNDRSLLMGFQKVWDFDPNHAD